MKLLIFVTGRGTGGDAVTAWNIRQALENRSITCDIVLDPSAQGYYFKNRGYQWLTSPIPAAGGHAASRSRLFRAGIRTITASISAARLIRREKADGVVGVIGGGVIIGVIGAKLARKPSVGVVATPTDTRISLRLNPTLLLPESPAYTKNVTSNYDVQRQYSPIKTDIIDGDKNNILDRLPDKYDPSKKSVLFSSGSTLFDDMAKAARKYAQENDNVNIFVIGAPLRDDLEEVIDHPNIINLGYINFMKDLYDLIDLAIITDDGLMLHETLACKIPVVVVIGVKYGRYHGLSKVFEGAMLESNVDNISQVVNQALDESEQMQEAASKFSEGILRGSDDLADFVIEHIKK